MCDFLNSWAFLNMMKLRLREFKLKLRKKHLLQVNKNRKDFIKTSELIMAFSLLLLEIFLLQKYVQFTRI